jgi:cytosine deaminase
VKVVALGADIENHCDIAVVRSRLKTDRGKNCFSTDSLSSIDGAKGMDTFMQAAFEEAEKGLQTGGIPIGSVLVHRDRIIGRGHNRRVQQGSPILHAEMDALANAGRQPASVYRESTLYTTLSPCAMCTGAILLYQIPRVVIGENRTFLGEEELLRSRGISVEVRNDPDCIRLMSRFIETHPELWGEDIGV